MAFKIVNIFKDGPEYTDDGDNNEYYDVPVDKVAEAGSNKMVLLEPRAYSEATQIADYLKKRNTVVLNLKRVTKEQAKRITDFVSGAIYAINGSMQKIGSGTFLCTPRNIDVEGKISDDKEEKGTDDTDDIKW